MRTLLTGEGGGEAAGSPLTQGKDAYELEVSPATGMRARGPPGAPVLPHGWCHALGAQWDWEILGSQSSFFPILGFVPWLRGPQVQWVRVWGAVWCPQGCDHAASVLQVLLRVKESEIQYLKQEISSLKDELQTALRVMPAAGSLLRTFPRAVLISCVSVLRFQLAYPQI